MKKLVSLFIAVLLAVALLLPAVVLAHTEDYPSTIDLIAGQNMDVGDVTVWNDGDKLYVKYETTGGWEITETHLHVATSLVAIPQKNGNPPPGQFDYQRDYSPGVTEDTHVIDLSWGTGTKLYIAAHAEVVHITTGCMDVVSDNTVQWSADQTSWQLTVLSWAHPSWPGITGVNWIWRTQYTDPAAEYATVPGGGWYFKKEFNIPGNPTSGTIAINADNAYTLSLNSSSVGGEGAMSKDGPDKQEWRTIQSFTLSGLQSGINTFDIRAINYFSSGSSSSNPAGLIFKASICYEDIDQETAWGAGGIDFPGKNWATCITYTVQ